MEIKKDIREQVHKKYDYKCGYCGDNIKYNEMQVDHIIPHIEFDNIKNILSEKLNLIK